jgi:hypothetical protein
LRDRHREPFHHPWKDAGRAFVPNALTGIMAAEFRKNAPEAEFDIIRKPLSKESVRATNRVWVTRTLMGAVPVIALEGFSSPVFRKPAKNGDVLQTVQYHLGFEGQIFNRFLWAAQATEKFRCGRNPCFRCPTICIDIHLFLTYI